MADGPPPDLQTRRGSAGSESRSSAAAPVQPTMHHLASALRRTMSRVLNISAIVALLCADCAVLAALIADVFYCASQRGQALAYKYAITALATVSLIVLVTIFILSSRKWTSASALSSIPRLYVPISAHEIPRRVAKALYRSQARSVLVLRRAVPLPGDVPDRGWGAPAAAIPSQPPGLRHTLGATAPPGAPAAEYAPQPQLVRYKDAIVQTALLLDHHAVRCGAPARRPEQSLRAYVEMLVDQRVISRGDVARFYISRYEQARFGPGESTATQYREAMKIFALVYRSFS